MAINPLFIYDSGPLVLKGILFQLVIKLGTIFMAPNFTIR